MDAAGTRLANNLKKLNDLIVFLRTNIELLEAIEEYIFSDQLCLELVNDTRAFWHVTIRGLWTQIVMDLSKLYDYSSLMEGIEGQKQKNAKHTISIASAYTICKQYEQELSAAFNEIRDLRFETYTDMQNHVVYQIKIAKEKVSILRKMRSKCIAHVDYQLYYGNKEQLEVHLNTVKELVDIATDIVSTYGESLFGIVYAFDIPGSKESVKLLQDCMDRGYREILEEAGFEV